MLADHFFTSMYGPTFPEHLYTVAAQSNGVIDNKTNADTEGSYCDDPLEFTKRFPLEDLAGDDISRIMDLEENITDSIPNQLLEIAEYWEDTRTCFDIPVLPDRLEKKDISWKYYGLPDQWMNGLQAIDHVWNGPMRAEHPGPRPDPDRPRERRAPGGVLARPAGGLLERAPRGTARTCASARTGPSSG